jgi:hypothetical protein
MRGRRGLAALPSAGSTTFVLLCTVAATGL